MYCKLCNKNEANQSGSHITSAFLLTSQIGSRGSERNYIITGDSNQNYLINRKDEIIKEDFIFCRDCEKRLSFLENYYCCELSQKIEKSKFNSNFLITSKKNSQLIVCKKISPIAFFLFIYSIIWRASISSAEIYKNFKLTSEIESDIQFFLDLFLPNIVNHKITIELSKWLKIAKGCEGYFKIYPFILLKVDNITDKTGTYQFFDNVSKNPYHIIINEYIILPFFDKDVWVDDFFNLKNEIDFNEIVNNDLNLCKIGIISKEKYLEILNMLNQLIINERLFNR